MSEQQKRNKNRLIKPAVLRIPCLKKAKDNMLLLLSCLSLDPYRRDAPAAAQGHSEGCIREGQGGSQEPGVSCYCPKETAAVRLTGQCVGHRAGDTNSTQCLLIILTGMKFSGNSLIAGYSLFFFLWYEAASLLYDWTFLKIFFFLHSLAFCLG